MLCSGSYEVQSQCWQRCTIIWRLGWKREWTFRLIYSVGIIHFLMVIWLSALVFCWLYCLEAAHSSFCINSKSTVLELKLHLQNSFTFALFWWLEVNHRLCSYSGRRVYRMWVTGIGTHRDSFRVLPTTEWYLEERLDLFFVATGADCDRWVLTVDCTVSRSVLALQTWHKHMG